MSHFPGPWMVHGTLVRGMSHGQYIPIARVQSRPFTPEGAEANARLIAAAPDLLAALRALVEFFRQFDGPDTFAEIDHPAKDSALALLARFPQ